MDQQLELYSARRCAADFIASLDRHGGDLGAAQAELVPICERFAMRPDLLELGVPRSGNHQAESAWLYYDGELLIMSARVPKQVRTPVHNHEVAEIVVVHSGEYAFTGYRRRDDGSVPGYADLEVIEDRVMRAGDSAVVIPPVDIHGYQALTEDTYIVVFTLGHFAKVRKYFDPANKSYVERDQQAWRLGGQRAVMVP